MHSDPGSKKLSKNKILLENISEASIYPSQVIEVYFCLKISYLFIFIKWAISGLFYLMNYKKSNIYWPILPVLANSAQIHGCAYQVDPSQ